MSIKLLKYKVLFNGKEYQPGEIINGLSKSEEARLLSKGVAEEVVVVYKDSLSDSDDSRNEDTGLNFDPDEYIDSGNKDKKVRK